MANNTNGTVEFFRPSSQVRAVISAFGIDVNGTLVNVTTPSATNAGLPLNRNYPLYNIVGGLAYDKFAAATLALDVLAFVAAVVLCAYAFFVATPRARSSAGLARFFGLRTAIVFFTLARLFSWLYEAIPNLVALHRGYLFFNLVPSAFDLAADTTLIWTLARTTCQPLVYASGYKRSLGIGLGFTIPYGLLAGACFILLALGIEITVRLDWTVWGPVDFNAQGGIAGVALKAMGLLWGFVYFGLAVRAACSRTLAASYRAVPGLMIGASIVWVVREAMIAVTEAGTWELVVGNGAVYNVSPLVETVFVDIFGLLLFGLLFACYRTSLAGLYVGAVGSPPRKSLESDA